MYVRYDTMDPMLTKEDRDIVTVFSRAQPMYFDATIRTVHVEAWLHDMEQIFLMCHVPDYLQVMLVARCLYGDARLWWIDLGEQQVPNRIWAQFRTVMLTRYSPLPPRQEGAPARDPEIYRDMRHTRYQMLSQAWHAYPGETMYHYWWRFEETMHPHVPQDLPEPELEAQRVLIDGLPDHIRQYVAPPCKGKTMEFILDEILAAEWTTQNAEYGAPANEGQTSNADNPVEPEPQYEVGPLADEDEDDVPEYVVGPLLGEEDDDVEIIDPPPQAPIPIVILSSDDEATEDFPSEVPDDEEDPEEIPDEEEELSHEDEPHHIVLDNGDAEYHGDGGDDYDSN